MQYEDNSFATGYALGQNSFPHYGGYAGGYGYGNGMFGNDAWWIIILLIFGWNGNGGFGNNGGNNMVGYELGKLATQSDIASGFSTSEIMSDLNDILLGQASIQQTLCQGFNGVNTAILQSANATERGFAQTNFNLQDCCCKVERAIDNVNFNAQKNTCDIIRSAQDNTRQILDFLTNEKICSLQADKAALTAQLSQNAQTATLINTLRPTAIPAYLTCSPYESTYGLSGYGRFNSCCNNNCCTSVL